MNSEPLHLRFEKSEAVELKKEILNLETDLLKTKSIIQRYSKLRMNEIKTKMRFHRKIKEISTDISKLEKNLPEIKVPKIFRHEVKEKPSIKIKEVEVKHDNSIDSQLRAIQEKLRSLQY